MLELTKYRYEIDLRRTPSNEVVEELRTISTDDLEALAHLMLESYRGTIDYEGEELDDAIDEVRSYFEDDPMLAHSFGAVVDGTIVSAILVSAVDGLPFIGYVMTLPEHKNQGWARRVAAAALRSLADAGHERVVFYITDGNLASEALFRSLGARRVEEE